MARVNRVYYARRVTISRNYNSHTAEVGIGLSIDPQDNAQQAMESLKTQVEEAIQFEINEMINHLDT
tara:strand:+ start:1227 stop:1427 length:201 start_codon:yes stop_codon:yes gene_type:complete